MADGKRYANHRKDLLLTFLASKKTERRKASYTKQDANKVSTRGAPSPSIPHSRYLSRHATVLPTGEERCVTKQITAAWETTLPRASRGSARQVFLMYQHFTLAFLNIVTVCFHLHLSPVQTSNFTCAESNANEQNLLFLLITIRFGTREVRRLNRAFLSPDKG